MLKEITGSYIPQCFTVLYPTMLHCPIPQNASLSYIPQSFTVLYPTILHCPISHNPSLSLYLHELSESASPVGSPELLAPCSFDTSTSNPAVGLGTVGNVGLPELILSFAISPCTTEKEKNNNMTMTMKDYAIDLKQPSIFLLSSCTVKSQRPPV